MQANRGRHQHAALNSAAERRSPHDRRDLRTARIWRHVPPGHQADSARRCYAARAIRDLDSHHPQSATRACAGRGDRRLGLSHGDHDRQAKGPRCSIHSGSASSASPSCPGRSDPRWPSSLVRSRPAAAGRLWRLVVEEWLSRRPSTPPTTFPQVGSITGGASRLPVKPLPRLCGQQCSQGTGRQQTAAHHDSHPQQGNEPPTYTTDLPSW